MRVREPAQKVRPIEAGAQCSLRRGGKGKGKGKGKRGKKGKEGGGKEVKVQIRVKNSNFAHEWVSKAISCIRHLFLSTGHFPKSQMK